MTIRINRKTLVAATAALTLFAGTAMAGPGDGPGRKGPAGDPSSMVLRHLAHQVEQLDLDDAQDAAIEAIFDDSKADLKANRLAARDNRAILHDILTADTLDEDALASAARTEGDLVAERIVIAATAASAVKAELDADQLAELEANITERRERMAEHRAERRGAE